MTALTTWCPNDRRGRLHGGRTKVRREYLIAAHPLQQAILDAVAGHEIEKHTLREIAAAAGFKKCSPQQVKHHLGQMVRYGFLDIVGGKYRVGAKLRRSR